MPHADRLHTRPPSAENTVYCILYRRSCVAHILYFTLYRTYTSIFISYPTSYSRTSIYSILLVDASAFVSISYIHIHISISYVSAFVHTFHTVSISISQIWADAFVHGHVFAFLMFISTIVIVSYHISIFIFPFHMSVQLYTHSHLISILISKIWDDASVHEFTFLYAYS